MDTPSDSPVFTTLGLAPDLVDYRQALERQQQLHSEVLAGTAPSTVLLLEHADVYTAGKRTEPEDLPRDDTPVIDVDRGGKLTWHGEGQLVVYPIIRLADRAAVKDYVCALERTVIDVLRRDYGIESTRVEGRSGVWITGNGPDRKIAAIGLRVHHSVTTHGLALNCSNDPHPSTTSLRAGFQTPERPRSRLSWAAPSHLPTSSLRCANSSPKSSDPSSPVPLVLQRPVTPRSRHHLIPPP
jgi:lipoyl(octanoyl) transferase